MGTCGEVVSDDADDAGGNACEFRGKFDPVSVVEESALFGRFVFPCDAEEVCGVDVPEACVFEAILDGLGDRGGVFHLGKCGDDDAPVAAALDGFLQYVLVDLIEFGHGPTPFGETTRIVRGADCVNRTGWRWGLV